MNFYDIKASSVLGIAAPASQGAHGDRRAVTKPNVLFFLFLLPLSFPFTGKLLTFWMIHSFKRVQDIFTV